jgi:predicted acylesterase/phospholipase RssA
MPPRTTSSRRGGSGRDLMPPDFPQLPRHIRVSSTRRARAYLDAVMQRRLLVDGVFEGGGALGTAYVGALRALSANGIWFARVAGNSAGAITAAMIAAGFSAYEIQWLSSSFPASPPLAAPSSLATRGITEPISFPEFLDLPSAATVTRTSRRRTQLWKALNGSVLDIIGETPLPIPTRKEMRDACVDAIVALPIIGAPAQAARPVLEGVLDAVLAPLPETAPQLRDFLPDTTVLRREFADKAWDAIAERAPLQFLLTNLVHEGGIYEGAAFTRLVGRLLSMKVHGDPAEPVQFRHLAIPLAVIAADIDTGEMQVYSSRSHPRMKVIDAVRRSMSIPFVFEPQGPDGQIVDGGLFANFPLFLFAAESEDYWPASSVDDSRIKIGFTLDESAPAPTSWGAGPGRWPVEGTPPRVDTTKVLLPILQAGLVDLGYPAAAVAAELAAALGFQPGGGGGSDAGIEILHQAVGVVQRGVLNTEQSTRDVLTAALMSGRTYLDVQIPLLGYHVLDFWVNTDEASLLGMWDRGWRTAIEQLVTAHNAGVLPSTVSVPTVTSPYS